MGGDAAGLLPWPLLPVPMVGVGLPGYRAGRCGVRRSQVELQRALSGRHPGEVKRAVELRLVTQQQQQGVRLLDLKVHSGAAVGRAFDAHLHAAEVQRVEPDRQVLRRSGMGCTRGEAGQDRTDLDGGGRGRGLAGSRRAGCRLGRCRRRGVRRSADRRRSGIRLNREGHCWKRHGIGRDCGHCGRKLLVGRSGSGTALGGVDKNITGARRGRSTGGQRRCGWRDALRCGWRRGGRRLATVNAAGRGRSGIIRIGGWRRAAGLRRRGARLHGRLCGDRWGLRRRGQRLELRRRLRTIQLAGSCGRFILCFGFRLGCRHCRSAFHGFGRLCRRIGLWRCQNIRQPRWRHRGCVALYGADCDGLRRQGRGGRWGHGGGRLRRRHRLGERIAKATRHARRWRGRAASRRAGVGRRRLGGFGRGLHSPITAKAGPADVWPVLGHLLGRFWSAAARTRQSVPV